MYSLRAVVVIFCVILGLTLAAPGGWGGSSHKHVKIIVPSYHHTVHHHHVEKIHVPVHVPVPVVKKVYVPVETHHHEPIHHEPIAHHDDWQGGWW